jgi:hypothetical protein
MSAPIIAAGAGLFNEVDPRDEAFAEYENNPELRKVRLDMLTAYHDDAKFDAAYHTYRAKVATTAGLISVRAAQLMDIPDETIRFPRVVTPQSIAEVVGDVLLSERIERLRAVDQLYAQDVSGKPRMPWYADSYKNGPVDVISGMVAEDYGLSAVDAASGSIAHVDHDILSAKVTEAALILPYDEAGITAMEAAEAILASSAIDEHLAAQLIQEQTALKFLVERS